MIRLYVASSWRNQEYPAVVERLRAEGFEVLDWRNPRPGDHGFQWSSIDPHWQQWTVPQYIQALEHPRATHGAGSDYAFMVRADACVLLLPCGRSAHLEAGWFIGQGKPTYIIPASGGEPELMYALADAVCQNLDVAIRRLKLKFSEVV